MQHPSRTNGGTRRSVPVFTHEGLSTKSVMPLPSSYTSVSPAVLNTKDFSAPVVQGPLKPT